MADEISGKSGRVLFASAINISDADYATGEVTIDTGAVHGLSQYDNIVIKSVGGMTDINEATRVESVTDTDTFVVSKTTAQSYTSGGTVQKCFDCTSWDLTMSTDVRDTTDSSHEGFETNIPRGIISGEGSFTGFFKQGYNEVPIGEVLAVKLSLADSTDYYSASGVITSNATTIPVPDTTAVMVTYSVKLSGTITQGT